MAMSIINVSMETFINNMNDLLDMHAPLEKISINKVKIQD